MKAEAQKILDMIEAVTPETAGEVLDEIDARVWCLLTNRIFDAFYGKNSDGSLRYFHEGSWTHDQFTRSIDAQEALRREGWTWVLDYHYGTPFMVMEKGMSAEKRILEVKTPALPSEPLARLHAWVQVMGMEE